VDSDRTTGAGSNGTGGQARPVEDRAGARLLLCLLTAVAAAVVGCKASSSSVVTDAAADGDGPIEVGLSSCPTSDGGSPVGVADEFGPNAKAGSASSALGQLDLYEITSARQLEWVDLYLRADLGGTRITLSVYEAAARNAVFRRLATVQLELPPCLGWVGSGALGIPLEVGRIYAIGFDPNQALTSFVDSEANDLPVDGQFGRLIGSKTSTSVSLDTLDWGKPVDNAFTRQRLYTSPRSASQDSSVDSSVDAPVGADGGGDARPTGDAASDRPG
jgi:hypothetical protein